MFSRSTYATEPITGAKKPSWRRRVTIAILAAALLALFAGPYVVLRFVQSEFSASGLKLTASRVAWSLQPLGIRMSDVSATDVEGQIHVSCETISTDTSLSCRAEGMSAEIDLAHDLQLDASVIANALRETTAAFDAGWSFFGEVDSLSYRDAESRRAVLGPFTVRAGHRDDGPVTFVVESTTAVDMFRLAGELRARGDTDPEDPVQGTVELVVQAAPLLPLLKVVSPSGEISSLEGELTLKGTYTISGLGGIAGSCEVKLGGIVAAIASPQRLVSVASAEAIHRLRTVGPMIVAEIGIGSLGRTMLEPGVQILDASLAVSSDATESASLLVEILTGLCAPIGIGKLNLAAASAIASQAVTDGDLETLDELRKVMGNSLLARLCDEKGRNLLILAAWHRQQVVVCSLLEHNADANIGHHGITALHLACDQRDAETAELLLAMGADVDRTGPQGLTPLHLAAAGNERLLGELFNAPRNAVASSNEPNIVLRGMSASFSFSSRPRNRRFVSMLVEAGASPHVETAGLTPLAFAVAAGDVEVIRYLCEQSAWIDGGIETPRRLASKLFERGRSSERREIIDYFERMATHQEALVVAARHGHVPTLDSELQRGAVVGGFDKSGITAIHTAAVCGHADAVRWLITQGAAVDAFVGLTRKERMVATQRTGVTPPLLLRRTPLLVAAAAGKSEVVRILLQAGADPSAQDEKGLTPPIAAAAAGDPNTVAEFVAHGVPVNDDSAGETLLHAAVRVGSVAVVSWLLDHGARVDTNTQQLAIALRKAEPDSSGRGIRDEICNLLACEGR